LASTADTRLVMTPRSSFLRSEIGTSERTTSPALSSPRSMSRSRKPRVIAASSTSLTVPPSAARIRFTRATLAVVQTHRRCGPIGPFRELAEGAVSRRALPPRPRPNLMTSARLRRRPCTKPGTSASCRSGQVTASRAPPTTRPATDGPGRGFQESGVTRAASGLRSNTAVMRSVPPMPSTMQ
jgi:hypothetical protein